MKTSPCRNEIQSAWGFCGTNIICNYVQLNCSGRRTLPQCTMLDAHVPVWANRVHQVLAVAVAEAIACSKLQAAWATNYVVHFIFE